MLVCQVRIKLFDARPLETTELFAIWKITPDGQVRRTVLSRDRRDTGSLLSAGESSARPSRVSQKSAQKCQHEENRSAANARECDGYDHGRCYFPWTKRPRRFCSQHSSGLSVQNAFSLPCLTVWMRSPLIPAWVSALFTASARLVPSAHVVFDRATLVAVSLDREADVRVLLQKLRPACNEPC